MDETQSVTWGQWIRTTLAWDGCLPLIAASARAIAPLMFADKVIVSLISFCAVPLLTALIRAHRAKQQLEEQVGRASAWRQMLLALAVLSLIFFEIMVAAWIDGGCRDPIGWVGLPAAYLFYLFLVALAVWPVRQAAN